MPLGSSLPALEAWGSACGVTSSAAALASVETSFTTNDGRLDSFCSNACSRSFASAATRLFLASSARPAHVTANSVVVRLATCARSLSRSAADWLASSTSAVLLFAVPRRRPFPWLREGSRKSSVIAAGCHRARLLPPSLPLWWSAVEHRDRAHRDHPHRRCP